MTGIDRYQILSCHTQRFVHLTFHNKFDCLLPTTHPYYIPGSPKLDLVPNDLVCFEWHIKLTHSLAPILHKSVGASADPGLYAVSLQADSVEPGISAGPITLMEYGSECVEFNVPLETY